MKLSTFILKNTGPFATLSLNIKKDCLVTVIAGEQGSGKTTLLKHLYHSLTWFQGRSRDVRSAGVVMNEQDIYRLAQISQLHIRVQINEALQQFTQQPDSEAVPCVYSWQLQKSKNSKSAINTAETVALDHLVKLYQQANHHDPDYGLPLLAYYPAERFIHEVNLLSKNNPLVLQAQYAYDLVSIPYTTFSRFFEWLREIHDIENAQAAAYLAGLQQLELTDVQQHLNTQPPRPHLTALKTALQIVLPEIEDLFLDYQPKIQLKVKINGEVMLYQQLGSSLKIWIALVGDIVRRLCVLNPTQLQPCCVGDGILLIDQIEQQLDEPHISTLLPRLQQAFPKLQVIVTTSNPELLHLQPEYQCLKFYDEKLQPLITQSMIFDENYRNLYTPSLEITETTPVEELTLPEQRYDELLTQIQQQLNLEQQQQFILDLQNLHAQQLHSKTLE